MLTHEGQQVVWAFSTRRHRTRLRRHQPHVDSVARCWLDQPCTCCRNRQHGPWERERGLHLAELLQLERLPAWVRLTCVALVAHPLILHGVGHVCFGLGRRGHLGQVVAELGELFPARAAPPPHTAAGGLPVAEERRELALALEQVLACRAVLFRLEARPRSGLLSACWPAVCAVVEVTLCAVLHARTHRNHAHTRAAAPFLGCPE